MGETECLMSTCDVEAAHSSGLCDWHHEKAYPDEQGLTELASYIRQENANHALCLRVGAYQRMAEQQRLHEKTEKLNAEEIADLFQVPREMVFPRRENCQ